MIEMLASDASTRMPSLLYSSGFFDTIRTGILVQDTGGEVIDCNRGRGSPPRPGIEVLAERERSSTRGKVRSARTARPSTATSCPRRCTLRTGDDQPRRRHRGRPPGPGPPLALRRHLPARRRRRRPRRRRGVRRHRHAVARAPPAEAPRRGQPRRDVDVRRGRLAAAPLHDPRARGAPTRSRGSASPTTATTAPSSIELRRPVRAATSTRG